ncbi:MAG: DUF2442 domain-containing protein [Pseudomonadota bacterium]|nr:DUF2442 domain-containing protein [Pseudomonadota bacterium]MDP1902898.1 DUF2442 domain-containing protein [Pseudomonadota bacterium]MDP2354098.1 DUF2442 domain-containing protein [Pseudomonadota bacterium]
MIKLLKIDYLGDFRFDLLFSDGSAGLFDLKSYFDQHSGTLLDALRNEHYARRFFIDAGAMCWPNGLELSARRLHELAVLKIAA